MRGFFRYSIIPLTVLVFASVSAGAEDADLKQVREAIKKHKERSAEDRQTLYKLHQIERDELKRVREIRDWAAMRFDDPLSSDGPRFKSRSIKVARYHELRRGVISHLVNLPVSNLTGQVWTGSGLNALQECLGAAALQHEVTLRHFEMIPENSLSSRDKERLELLRSISREVPVASPLLSNVQCVQGLTGQLLPIKLAFGKGVEMQMLPLDWPAFLRTSQDFKSYLDAVASAREDCIKAAGTGDFEPSRRLMLAVDDLDRRIAGVQKSNFRNIAAGYTDDGMKSREIYQSVKFVKTLRYSVSRFIELDSFPDVEEFLVNTTSRATGEQISLITVLAAMEERGLRFGRATRSSEAAHRVLFQRMRDYYASLYAISLAVHEQQETVEDIERLIRDSHDTERFGEVMQLGGTALTEAADVYKTSKQPKPANPAGQVSPDADPKSVDPVKPGK